VELTEKKSGDAGVFSHIGMKKRSSLLQSMNIPQLPACEYRTLEYNDCGHAAVFNVTNEKPR
jgi:hypothetical protein